MNFAEGHSYPPDRQQKQLEQSIKGQASGCRLPIGSLDNGGKVFLPFSFNEIPDPFIIRDILDRFG